MRVSAESDFPVKAGLSSIVVTGAPGGGGGVAPVAAFTANLVISPSTISGTTPFVVEFRDTSGGSPTAWTWDFDDGSVSTQQDPLDHTFTTTDPTHMFHVTLTASNPSGRASRRWTSSSSAPPTWTSRRARPRRNGQGSRSPTRRRRRSRTTHGTSATAARRPARRPPRLRLTTGSPFTVKLTVTYPSPIGDVTTTKPSFITVTWACAPCRRSTASSSTARRPLWNGAELHRDRHPRPGAPNGNFTIHVQSQTASLKIACGSDVAVKDK